MKPHDLKAARLRKGWVQVQVAEYLGVTQAYVNMLENGRRRLTPALSRRVTALYGLSPETLPLSEEFVPARTDNQHLAESLAKLGYPGFAYGVGAREARSSCRRGSPLGCAALRSQWIKMAGHPGEEIKPPKSFGIRCQSRSGSSRKNYRPRQGKNAIP